MTSRRTAVDLWRAASCSCSWPRVFAGLTTAGRPSVGAAGAVGAARSRDGRPPTAGIAAAQQRLADVPGDWRDLGAARGVLRGAGPDHRATPRTTPKAEGSLERSLALRPDDNDRRAHRAGRAGQRPARLRRRAATGRAGAWPNPYGATAYGVLDRRPHPARRLRRGDGAVRRMLELKPGHRRPSPAPRTTPSCAATGPATGKRSSRRWLDAGTPADMAYCRDLPGRLACVAGRPRPGRAPLRRRPGGPRRAPCGAGPGPRRGGAGRGRRGPPRATPASSARCRSPEYLVEYGEFLLSVGRADQAARAVRRARRPCGSSSRPTACATTSPSRQFEADHGDPARGARRAEAEFGRRHNIDAADALGWALHKAGRTPRRCPHAAAATASAGRNALLPLPPRRDRARARPGRPGAAHARPEALREPVFPPLLAPRGLARLLTSLGGPRDGARSSWAEPRRRSSCCRAASARRPSAGQLHRQPLRRPAVHAGPASTCVPSSTGPRSRPLQEMPDIAPDGTRARRTWLRRAAAECPALARDVVLTVDGDAVSWTVGATALEIVPGTAGLPTLRLTC